MATITIRNLDETVKRELQVRAALNGRSMEAEARELLADLLKHGSAGRIRKPMGTAIRQRLAAVGGVELTLPERTFSTRPLPDFEP